MRDIIDEIHRWWAAGGSVGVATVVQTWHSAPRPPGAALAVGPDGSVVGNVSGGCIEAAVYELAAAARAGAGLGVHHFGVGDEEACAVGLTCGGTISVLVEQVDRASFPDLDEVVADVRAGRPVAVATTIDGDRAGRRVVVRPGTADGADPLVTAAGTALSRGHTGVVVNDDTASFVGAFLPQPRLLVFGATDIGASLTRLGRQLGCRVTVCDARATFATQQRFPDADELVVAWPHRYLAGTPVDRRSAVCVLTHDPKFDIPLLEVALRLPIGYVGALGSRRTNDARVAALRERGLGEHELARLHAPIGLDLGARTPDEIALSIAAELVAVRRGGSGAPLHATSGPIHAARAEQAAIRPPAAARRSWAG